MGLCTVDYTLQVSVYSGYDLCHPDWPKVFLSILTHLTLKSRWNPRQLLHPCQLLAQCRFGDRRSVGCRYKHFLRCPKPIKVGQGELGFSLQGLFTSMSLCARFEVCVQRLRFVTPFNVTDRQTYRQTDRQTDPQPDGFCTEYVNSSAGWWRA